MSEGSTGLPQNPDEATGPGVDVTSSTVQATAAVKIIGKRALTTNLARVAELDTAMAAIVTNRLDEEQRKAARLAAHRLAGSAGTFGFPLSSRLSRDLEEFFKDAAFHHAARLRQAQQWLRELHSDLAGEPRTDADE